MILNGSNFVTGIVQHAVESRIQGLELVDFHKGSEAHSLPPRWSRRNSVISIEAKIHSGCFLFVELRVSFLMCNVCESIVDLESHKVSGVRKFMVLVCPGIFPNATFSMYHTCTMCRIVRYSGFYAPYLLVVYQKKRFETCARQIV